MGHKDLLECVRASTAVTTRGGKIFWDGAATPQQVEGRMRIAIVTQVCALWSLLL